MIEIFVSEIFKSYPDPIFQILFQYVFGPAGLLALEDWQKRVYGQAPK
jgi:hypothetical protein